MPTDGARRVPQRLLDQDRTEDRRRGHAGRGFGHARGANYRGLDEADAWGRVLATLKRDHRQPE